MFQTDCLFHGWARNSPGSWTVGGSTELKLKLKISGPDMSCFSQGGANKKNMEVWQAQSWVKFSKCWLKRPKIGLNHHFQSLRQTITSNTKMTPYHAPKQRSLSAIAWRTSFSTVRAAWAKQATDSPKLPQIDSELAKKELGFWQAKFWVQFSNFCFVSWNALYPACPEIIWTKIRDH